MDLDKFLKIFRKSEAKKTRILHCHLVIYRVIQPSSTGCLFNSTIVNFSRECYRIDVIMLIKNVFSQQ